ncbi:MAG: hypothetical protein IKE81_04395, partial [Clostridia bacterium]|nr:hypothetical protein [Clostridia bacterium]
MKVLEVFGEPIASGGQEAFAFNVLRHIDRRDLTIDFFTPYTCTNGTYRQLISDCDGKLFCAGLPFAPGSSRANIIREFAFAGGKRTGAELRGIPPEKAGSPSFDQAMLPAFSRRRHMG